MVKNRQITELQRRLDAQHRVIADLITELVTQGRWTPNQARTAIHEITDGQPREG